MTPRSGFKIGRIFGIDIVINVTWLVIFVLVGISFGDLLRETYTEQLAAGGQVVERVYFPGGAWPWIIGFVMALVFFVCLILHELSHSYVAKRSGIQIRRITLFLFGGVAEMAEDVKSPGTEFAMAIAGPLVTFILAGAFYGLFLLAGSLDASLVIVAPLQYLVWVNIFIGVFNLLPGFPLDGGRVLRSILWKITGDIRKATRVASIAGQGFGLAIAGAGIALIFLNLIGGFWFIIIGVFLYTLAKASYKQTLIRLAATDTLVKDIMYTDVPLVEADTPLTALKNNYFASYRLPAFPVVREGRLLGLVTIDDLSNVVPAEWDILNAGRIAKPVSRDQAVSPDTPLSLIIKSVMEGESFFLVAEGSQVEGVLTREEVLRYVDMRLNAPRKRR